MNISLAIVMATVCCGVSIVSAQNTSIPHYDPCEVGVVPLPGLTVSPSISACMMSGPNGDGRPITECCPWIAHGTALEFGPERIETRNERVAILYNRTWENRYDGPTRTCQQSPIPPIPLVISESTRTLWEIRVCYNGQVEWGGSVSLTAMCESSALFQTLMVEAGATLTGSVRLGVEGCVQYQRETTLTFSHGTPHQPIMIPCGMSLHWLVEKSIRTVQGSQEIFQVVSYVGVCGSTRFESTKLCSSGQLQGEVIDSGPIVRRAYP